MCILCARPLLNYPFVHKCIQCLLVIFQDSIDNEYIWKKSNKYSMSYI